MSVTVACDECFPAAKNVVRFSEEIYERDKIERLVYDWCAGQKITPVACPNDLLRCLKTRCLAIAANAGVGTPCNEIILPCFRDVIVQDGEIDIGLDCAWNRAVQYEETGIRFFAQNLPPPIGFDRRGTDDDYSACSCSDGRQGFGDTHIVSQDDTPALPAKSLGFKLMRPRWLSGGFGFFVLLRRRNRAMGSDSTQVPCTIACASRFPAPLRACEFHDWTVWTSHRCGSLRPVD